MLKLNQNPLRKSTGLHNQRHIVFGAGAIIWLISVCWFYAQSVSLTRYKAAKSPNRKLDQSTPPSPNDNQSDRLKILRDRRDDLQKQLGDRQNRRLLVLVVSFFIAVFAFL